jgi:hypothetical protein
LQQADAPSHAHDDDAEDTTTQWGCHRETIMLQNGNEQSLLFSSRLVSFLLFSSLVASRPLDKGRSQNWALVGLCYYLTVYLPAYLLV